MTSTFSFEITQGILIGIVFGLGTLLVSLLPKYKWAAASALCVLITPLALLPFWFSYGPLGISDWDYYFSMHTNLREAIVHYNEFPLWNPYTCGGTSALGDPEFPVLSPLFLLELLFGTPAGLRLSIYFSTAIGSLGMLHLSRKLGLSVLGGLVAALAMAFGTVNLLEIVEGHQNILAAMYIPWVWYFWYSAYTSPSTKKQRLYIVAIAILLALMFFQGGIYLLMYMTGAFAIIAALVTKPKQAIQITLLAGLLGAGLASIKLVPVALWIQEFSDKAYASSAYTLSSLDDIFLGRILYGAEDIIPSQGGGWHEYGAYIGPVVLLLSCIGFLFYRKNRVTQALLISAVLATGVSSLGPYLKPIFDQLPFIPRSNISRVILFAVIPISLLAGYGIEGIQKRSKLMRLFAVMLITIAAVDLISLAYPLSSQSFVLQRVEHEIPQSKLPISYNPLTYKVHHKGVDYTRSYEATLKGYGNMTYCSVLGPEPSISVMTDEGRGEILSFSDDKDASFTLESWKPSNVRIIVRTTKETEAVLNANYAIGWYVNGIPAKEIGNRPGILIPAGETLLEFSYVPPGMYVGAFISALSILILFYYLFRK